MNGAGGAITIEGGVGESISPEVKDVSLSDPHSLDVHELADSIQAQFTPVA